MIARMRGTGFSTGRRRRLIAAAGAVALHAALIGALLTLRPSTMARPIDRTLVALDLSRPEPAPDPPPPAEPRQKQKPKPKAEGAAAPPNLKARPKPIAVPPVTLAPPPAMPAAPVAAKGPDAEAGAAERPGPGTGAGGTGSGLGSGGIGSGTGGGSGGVRARRIQGGINIADYPRAAAAARAGGTVILHLDIDTAGRVSACRVARSSGNTDLDRTTCRLATERFRYRPATDAAGRPVPDIAGWRQDWWLTPRD